MQAVQKVEGQRQHHQHDDQWRHLVKNVHGRPSGVIDHETVDSLATSSKRSV
jgi:hypothetical protein